MDKYFIYLIKRLQIFQQFFKFFFYFVFLLIVSLDVFFINFIAQNLLNKIL